MASEGSYVPQFARPSSESIDLHALRLENESLREQVLASRSLIRRQSAMVNAIRKLVVPNFALPVLEKPSEQQIYALTSATELTHLDDLPGRKIQACVLGVFIAHFWQMVEHVGFCKYGMEKNEFRSHPDLRLEVMNLLAQVMKWVFVITVVGSLDELMKPRAPLMMLQEVRCFLKAGMYVRAKHFGNKRFPVALMHQFVLNWNSFASCVMRIHPVPLMADLGQPGMKKPTIVFPADIVCRAFVTKRNDIHLLVGSKELESRETPGDLIAAEQQGC